jgi:predicted small lipoprotein YifL
MNCWARYLLYLMITILALGHMVAACGQKGPLYLSDAASEGAGQATPTPVPDASGEDLEALDDVPVVPPEPDSQ